MSGSFHVNLNFFDSWGIENQISYMYINMYDLINPVVTSEHPFPTNIITSLNLSYVWEVQSEFGLFWLYAS
jgi:hypothetical protein